MGKTLQLNTYVYSQIWNNAFIINTKDKHFRNFIKNIESYLQPTKGNEVLENIAKRKNEGGLNLINISDRINTLKIKQILEADKQLPETDNIIYMVGTKDEKVYGKKISGPKTEINTEKKKALIRKIEENKQNIMNYK